MQDYVTPLPFAALIAAHIAGIAVLFTILHRQEPSYPGWRMLGPSGSHWFAFLGAWGFGALISWVWVFVGSVRADAEFQMKMALLLAMIFTSAGAAMGLYINSLRRKALRWRGGAIRWRTRGHEHEQAFANFDAIRRALDGTFQIRFKDQTILKLDLYERNADDFLARFSEALGHDVY